MPQSCTTKGLPVSQATRPEGSQWAWTRSASRERAPGGAGEREEEERQSEREPRAAAEVAGDAVPVGDAVVAEPRRRDDDDVDAGGAGVLDRVLDEVAGDVRVVARVRRRQDGDLHSVTFNRRRHEGSSRRPNTIGAASAIVANAKK